MGKVTLNLPVNDGKGYLIENLIVLVVNDVEIVGLVERPVVADVGVFIFVLV